MRNYTNKYRGFTLIELLVVISIIALLMAIMMPAMSRVRESGSSTVCKSNLKGITTAAILWSQDRNDYVVSGSWHVPAVHPSDDTGQGSAMRKEATDRGASLEPYTGSQDTTKGGLYTCPTAKRFGEDFYSIATSVFASTGKSRKDTIAYGVNSFAVLYSGTNYIGAKGEQGTNAYYAAWGPNNTYMLERGKSRLSQIKNGSKLVYFTDFSYPQFYDWMYNPLKVCYYSGSSYGFVDTFSNVPGGAKIVQARWHGKVDTSTGYGDSNIAWFDGSVTGEPQDFDDPTPLRASGGGFGGGSKSYAWQKYIFEKH